MKMLLTGGNGQLGRACQELFKDYDLLVTDADTLDITDHKASLALAKTFRPDIILHTAAYTNVKGAESDPQACYAVNMRGTAHLVSLAQECGSTFVYISTDFVFDGRAHRPYREDDAVNPLNVYGRSKLVGELLVRDMIPKHYIVRTAWLYGEGKNFVRTILAAADEQKELKVVNDQRGTPTYAGDLAVYIEALLTQSAPYGIYHATNSGETTWAGLAQEALRLAGKAIPVVPITTSEAQQLFGDATVRPSYSVLSKEKLARFIEPRSWQEALRSYVS